MNTMIKEREFGHSSIEVGQDAVSMGRAPFRGTVCEGGFLCIQTPKDPATGSDLLLNVGTCLFCGVTTFVTSRSRTISNLRLKQWEDQRP